VSLHCDPQSPEDPCTLGVVDGHFIQSEARRRRFDAAHKETVSVLARLGIRTRFRLVAQPRRVRHSGPRLDEVHPLMTAIRQRQAGRTRWWLPRVRAVLPRAGGSLTDAPVACVSADAQRLSFGHGMSCGRSTAMIWRCSTSSVDDTWEVSLRSVVPPALGLHEPAARGAVSATVTATRPSSHRWPGA